MGVDWLTCNYCGENFPDCGSFVSCECGEHWCSDECAEEDGFKFESCKLGYDVDDNDCGKGCYRCENFVQRSCNYCRKEDFEDYQLLDFALEMLGKTRQELINDYKNRV